MSLGSTQPLTEMCTRGKCGRCVWLTTLPPSCADCLEIWEPRPPGTLWACPGLSWDCFTFTFTSFYVSVTMGFLFGLDVRSKRVVCL
jgi:hypothetical protein